MPAMTAAVCQKGQRVRKGEKIAAKEAQPAAVNSPQLHFEIAPAKGA